MYIIAVSYKMNGVILYEIVFQNMTKIIGMFMQSSYFELDLTNWIWYPQILYEVQYFSRKWFFKSSRRLGAEIRDTSYNIIRKVRNVRNIKLVSKSMLEEIFAKRLERGGIFRCPRAL